MSAIRNYLDEEYLGIARCISKRGLAVMSIGYGECSRPGCDCSPEPFPFTYTIGLVERGHPELIVFSDCMDCSAKLCNWVHDRDVAGEHIAPDTPVEFTPGGWLRLVPVPPEWMLRNGDEFFAAWIRYYAKARQTLGLPDVLQVVWADADGRFPDAPACDPLVTAQQPIVRDDPSWTRPVAQPNRAARRGPARRRR